MKRVYARIWAEFPFITKWFIFLISLYVHLGGLRRLSRHFGQLHFEFPVSTWCLCNIDWHVHHLRCVQNVPVFNSTSHVVDSSDSFHNFTTGEYFLCIFAGESCIKMCVCLFLPLQLICINLDHRAIFVRHIIRRINRQNIQSSDFKDSQAHRRIRP